MKKQISLFLFIIWFTNTAFSQDIEFEWKIQPSFGDTYNVKIEKKEINCSFQINERNCKDKISTRISEADCDLLTLFLSNYSFTTKGNCFTMGEFMDFQKVKLLRNKKWILLNGDSIQLSKAQAEGLKFDKVSKKFYYLNTMKNCITDGTYYSGKFQTNNQIKEYNIHSGRLSEKDYELNCIIHKLIKKYFPDQDYSILLKQIEENKVAPKNYQ